VKGVRDDYLQSGKVDLLLHNPDWPIMPSVAYIKGVGPRVLTCRHHDRGDCKRYLHPPRHPKGTLPSDWSDQIAPAVVVPRTIKSLRAHSYSHTYQMCEMRGQFGGVDTMGLTEKHRFDYRSVLALEKENTLISNRADIRALLTRWKNEGHIIPLELGEEMLRNADADRGKMTGTDQNPSQHRIGSTMVTSTDAMLLQRQFRNPKQTLVRVTNDDTGEVNQIICTGKWVPTLTWVHPCEDSFGSPFSPLPPLRSRELREIDSRALWLLVGVNTTVPNIWHGTVDAVDDTKKWHGWLLTYATETCFPEMRISGKRSPYKFRRLQSKAISTLKCLGDGIEDQPLSHEDFASLFDDHSSVQAFHSSDDPGDMQQRFATANDGVNTLLFVRKEAPASNQSINSTSQLICLGIGEDEESSWRLVAVAITESGNPRHKWRGRFYCRHSGAQFSGWWMHTRGRPWFERAADLSEDGFSNWDVCVYVRTCQPDIEDMKQSFLIHSLGGQDKVFCSKHNVPFITAIYKGEGSCGRDRWTQPCTQRPVLQCPMTGCDNYICSRHYDNIARDITMYLVPREESDNDSSTVESRSQQPSQNGAPSLPVWIEADPDAAEVGDACYQGSEASSADDRSIASHYHYCSSDDSELPLFFDADDGEHSVFLEGASTGGGSEYDSDHPPLHSSNLGRDQSARNRHTFTFEAEESMEEEWVVHDDGTMSLTEAEANHDLMNRRIRHPVDVSDGDPFYGCIDAHYDEDRFIVDVGDCIAGMHSMEFDDGAIARAIEDGTLVPTTTCNQGAPTIVNKGGYLPGHVILNNVGSLLVRRDHKLKGTTRQQNFLQRIVSTCPGQCVPLLYPEASIFPSIFWTDAGPEFHGSIPGALPCSFLCSDQQMAAQGMATISHHMRCRLSNTSLLASTDPRYICYAFDSLVNLGMRGGDSRVILSRGFASKQGSCGIKGEKDALRTFDTDTTDSRPVVHRLAAAVAQEQARYFYTHTCNQRDHFGVCRIKEWIDSEEYIVALCESHGQNSWDETARCELRKAGIMSAAVVLLRNWMETAEIFMKYIANSPEEPLGRVRKIWWRHEYQDGVGNLSHIHSLIWLEDESMECSMDRIRGSIAELIREEEVDPLIEEGLIRSFRDVDDIREHGARVLRHTCSPRCKTQIGEKDGQVRCRVANTIFQNPTPTRHIMKEVSVGHNKQATAILQHLGLFAISDVTGEPVPCDDLLRATRHYPPCQHIEGVISPVNGRLFAGHLSLDNLQIVTGYGASRYLAKYVAGIDEHNRVHIGAAPNMPNAYEFDMQFLHNTKVGHSALNEKARLAARRDAHHANRGRAMSIMEIIALIFGYDQVHTTIKFRHISTHPMGERAAYKKVPTLKHLQDEGLAPPHVHSPTPLDECRTIPSHIARQGIPSLPAWRRHTPTQLILLRNQIISPLTMDSVTIFGVRPPELRFIRDQSNYFRWFVREQPNANMSTAKAVKMFQNNLDGNYRNTS